MRHFTFILLIAGLCCWSTSLQAQIIASQDFNSLSGSTFCTDMLPSGGQLTNSAANNTGGPGLDFASFWFDTRGEGFGPVTNNDGNDFIGVNSFSGASAPDVAADGTPVSGSEQNFQFNDTDGALVLNFEGVDVSGFTNRQLSLNYWIHNTGYESNDAFTISLSNGGFGSIVVLGFGETELEANAETGEGNATSWKSLTVDLEALLTSSGLDPTNLILSIAVDVNSSAENIFVDDIVFESVPQNACSIDALTASFLPCNDNGTNVPEDDSFIADFTISLSNQPATGDIELSVGGQTYSTSVVGIGNTFQFLSIPLPANGQDVIATVSFTADPGCSLTTSVGTAPQPCSVIDPCTELFISEYAEGSGFNKCIEIYNPTGMDIDLASFGLFLSFNGGTFENTIPLMGTIPSNDVYVICNAFASSEFLTLSDQVSFDLNFNGNDAVLLQNANGTIDALGQLGNASNYGQNVTLRRDFSVTAGDNNPFDAFSTAGWNSFPSNTAWGFGYHSSACGSLLPPGWNLVTPGCTGASASFNSGTFNLFSNCFNPSPGQDDLTYVFQPLCGDGELIAFVDVTTPGRAGLMFRESVAANAKFVWFNTGGDNRAYLSRRMMDNGPVQTAFKPQFNRKWMRLTRQGNLFRAYLSINGTMWQQVFQLFMPMDQCLYAGLATYSYVDFAPVTGTFSNVQFNPGAPTLTAPDNAGILDAAGDQDLQRLNTETADGELQLRPNPASDRLEVVLPEWTNEQVFLNIHDVNGKQLFADRVERFGNTIVLDLKAMNLSPGVYLLTVNDGKQITTRRFIKS